MQSTDRSTIGVGGVDIESNGNNDSDDDVVEHETLIDSTNDVVVRESGESILKREGEGLGIEDVVVKPKTLANSSNDVVRESGDSILNREGEGFELDDGNEDMEVDFVENIGPGAVLKSSKNLVEAVLLQSECSIVNGGEEGQGCRTSEPVVNGEDYQESLEGEEGDEYMVVEFVENSGAGMVLEGSKDLAEGKERSFLCGERDSVIGEGNSVEGSYLGTVLGQSVGSEVCAGENGKRGGRSEVVVYGVDDQGNLGKANFKSSARKLFPKALNEDIVGKQVMTTGVDGSCTIIGNGVKVNESSCVVGNQATDGITNSVVSGGVSATKAASSVVDLNSNVPSRGDMRRKKGGFCTSDLVWGKVRSHPWWPAQIFEPQDASEQAQKHFKPKTYLLAYFGDQTFAWNEEAKLKPFAPHFSQMVKQSNAEPFQDAVNCALDEASRRVEFGLSCHCIACDVSSRLKIQVIKNAGIREKLRIQESMDRLYKAATFDSVKFLDTVKNLAQVPHVEDNFRLEFVVAHSQMSAFYRWKGCYHLAEFEQLRGYVNNEADAPVSTEKEEMDQLIAGTNVAPDDLEEDLIRPQKRKKMSGDSGNTTKKVKHLPDSMRKKGKKVTTKEDDDKDSEGRTGRKLVSSSPKRRKEAKLSSNEPKLKESSPQITPLRHSKLGLRVGEGILRAALQLSQPSPLLKLDVSSQGKTTKGSNKSKQRQKQTEAISFKKSSPDATLSKLLLAAVCPLKEHSFISSITSFFSDFRDSVVQDAAFVPEHGESESYDIVANSQEGHSGVEEMNEGFSSGGDSKETGSACEIATSSGVKSEEDGKIIEGPELLSSMADEEMVPVDPELVKVDGTSTAALEIDSSVSGSLQRCTSENVASESGLSDKDIIGDESPTALTLKFTDMDSIPTEAKLIKIFSAFGHLKESETEVLAKKNCARVVFKRRVDAETAFSSSGKFETFGASLVCYQLNYAPSPRKSPSPEAKKRRKDGTLADGIAA